MDDLSELIERLGKDKASDILRRYSGQRGDESDNALTIVANRGVHHLPDENLRGTVFYASEGNLDFSSAESVQEEFERILEGVARILKSRSWKQVFIVPFGPCALSMQIKLLIYRITRIESIDIFHLGQGEYMDLEVKQRHIIVNAG